MTITNTTSAPAGSSTSAAQPADGATANGTTVPLPNEPPAGTLPAANSQVDPASALPSVPSTATPATVDFQQALDSARRALASAQDETITLRREMKRIQAERDAAEMAKRDAEMRAAQQAVQTAAAAATPAAAAAAQPLQAPTAAPPARVPATPPAPPSIPAPPYPASNITGMGMTLFGAAVASSAWRVAASIFIPLLTSFTAGSIVYNLAQTGVMAVATLSGFFLWPILIMILGALIGVWAMYNVFKLTYGYIDSGKAEQHLHTVWGWLSSPVRVVETQDQVLRVEGKVDQLLLTQGVRP